MLTGWEVRRLDVLLGASLAASDAEGIYGRAVHVVQLRSPCRKEIRAAVSSYPHTNVIHP